MKILITGTNSGIGKYLKENLEKNYEVFKVSKSPSKELDFYKCDLTKKDEIEKLDFRDNIFDIVIFNAGVGYYSGFFEGNLENYEEIINLNLLSPIRLLRKLKPNIKKESKIIFIGSISGKKFFKNGSIYTASKFGLRGFAGALKKDGLKTYLINPKIVETDFHKGKINLPDNAEFTDIKSILETTKNIISGKENRFEIDL